jgi:hypothetical protein
MEGYQKALQSGLQMIPQSREIQEVLGDADHFISYHGSLVSGCEWNTEVFFGGRYCLTMQVPVRMGKDFDKVLAVVGEPAFDLVEVEEIREDGLVIYNRRAERRFGAKEWSKVYKAHGDFSAIDIKLQKGPPVKNFDKHVQQVRKDRVRVAP